MITKPFSITFLGDDVIEVDGVKITLELVREAMNPTDLARRTLFSVKRVGEHLEFTSYWDSKSATGFFDKLKDKQNV